MTAGGDDDGADVRPHDSRVVRAMLFTAGTLCVALGVIGVVVGAWLYGIPSRDHR